MKLIVDNGVYEEDNLPKLLWTVIKHRLHHFFKGEGFTD